MDKSLLANAKRTFQRLADCSDYDGSLKSGLGYLGLLLVTSLEAYQERGDKLAECERIIAQQTEIIGQLRTRD